MQLPTKTAPVLALLTLGTVVTASPTLYQTSTTSLTSVATDGKPTAFTGTANTFPKSSAIQPDHVDVTQQAAGHNAIGKREPWLPTKLSHDISWDMGRLGACGHNHTYMENIISLSAHIFDKWTPADGDTTKNPLCGKRVKLGISDDDQATHQVVTIVDRCDTCYGDQFDISSGLWADFAPLVIRSLSGVWQHVDAWPPKPKKTANQPDHSLSPRAATEEPPMKEQAHFTHNTNWGDGRRGACGHNHTKGDKVVSLYANLFDVFTPGDGDTTRNQLCGKRIRLSIGDDPSLKHDAIIADRCESCGRQTLDLTEGLWMEFAPQPIDNLKGKWEAVDPWPPAPKTKRTIQHDDEREHAGPYYHTLSFTGPDACGQTHSENDSVVALDAKTFDQYTPANGDTTQNPLCGKRLLIEDWFEDGKIFDAWITDRCADCRYESLNLSPALFQKFASLEEETIMGVWNLLDPWPRQTEMAIKKVDDPINVDTKTYSKRGELKEKRNLNLENIGTFVQYTLPTDHSTPCGHNASSPGLYVAVPGNLFAPLQCGKTVTLSANGHTAKAVVTDRCSVCGAQDLGLSPSLFQKFAPLSHETIANGSWELSRELQFETRQAQINSTLRGVPRDGDFTHYNVYAGLDGCPSLHFNYTLNVTDFFVTVDGATMFWKHTPPDGQENGLCGRWVMLKYGDKVLEARVVGACDGCGEGNLDLTKVTFERFAPLGADDEKIRGTWWFV